MPCAPPKDQDHTRTWLLPSSAPSAPLRERGYPIRFPRATSSQSSSASGASSSSSLPSSSSSSVNSSLSSSSSSSASSGSVSASSSQSSSVSRSSRSSSMSSISSSGASSSRASQSASASVASRSLSSTLPTSSSVSATLPPTTSAPPATTSISTIIETSTGPASTVFATGRPTSAGNGDGSTPFARNVGGIVGVAIGALVAIVVGGTLVFLLFRQLVRAKRQRTADVALARAAGVDGDGSDADDGDRSQTRSPHYGLRRDSVGLRPPMPAPVPSSRSSIAALLSRLRRGGSYQPTPQSELEMDPVFSAGAVAAAPPLAPVPVASPIAVNPLAPLPPGALPPATAPSAFSPLTASPRPSSLLNPRQYPDLEARPLSPPIPPWLSGSVAPVGDATPPATASGEALVAGGERAAQRSDTPEGLLRPSLAMLQRPSFMDSVDYSRALGGRVAVRSDTMDTIDLTPSSEPSMLPLHGRHTDADASRLLDAAGGPQAL
ncbi:hypothetical protein HMN09_00062700 [Mycena chlorophos]|uniref:REJ domain-containing protein n=1 Tax=Mycena chlorophos TaxID=658473 RepID=A0A8H6WPZ8_MYCCL|nr:hypothetical protein HMN09_00062700 [Mycena chlorophos]